MLHKKNTVVAHVFRFCTYERLPPCEVLYGRLLLYAGIRRVFAHPLKYCNTVPGLAVPRYAAEQRASLSSPVDMTKYVRITQYFGDTLQISEL